MDFSTSPSTEDCPIPRTEKDIAADLKLDKVVRILRSLDLDPSLPEKEAKSLAKYALKFALRGNSTLVKKSAVGPRIVLTPERRPKVLAEAHDLVGHKGFVPTYFHIRLRFWWPSMAKDVAWYVRTCHTCQQRQVRHNLRVPIVQQPAPLFVKVYIDVMHMSIKSGGYLYIVQGRCSLTSYVEARPLRSDMGQTIGNFIFEEILCRWGTIMEIVTDNGPSMIKAMEYLAKRWHINHIRISPYNSRAQGIVENKHFSLRESLFKACETAGAEEKSWSRFFHHTLWAERVTYRRHMGCSPYFAAHGVHPILPFDIVEATSLLPAPDSVLTTEELIARRAVEFSKRQDDLNRIHDKVFKFRNDAMEAYAKKFAHKIKDYQFERGHLVLVRNTRYEKSLDRKHRIRYLGPMIFLAKNRGGAFILCELDGTVSIRPFAAFRVIPYFPRKSIPLPPIEDFLDISGSELDQRISSTEADPDAFLDHEVVEPEEDLPMPDFDFGDV